MGRAERPVDPTAGAVAAFAAELRLLREKAGSPKYLAMARATGRSRTALSEAAGGDHLPTWETVEAFVAACGADPRVVRGQWQRAKDAGRSPVTAGPSHASAGATPPSGSAALPMVSPLADPSEPARMDQPPHERVRDPARLNGRGGAFGNDRLPIEPRRRSARTPVRLILTTGTAAAVGVLAYLGSSDAEDLVVSGTVRCPADLPVVGVWVKTSAAGSGFASWSPAQSPSEATFSRTMPTAEAWSVNVGCGGTPGKWELALRGAVSTTETEQQWSCSLAGDAATAGCWPDGATPD